MKSFRYTALIVSILFFSAPAFSQEAAHTPDPTEYKVVIQLTNGDTLVHMALVKQIGHILEAAPNTKIEVVCHSGGLPFLVSAQTTEAAKIKTLQARGVEFSACENTMRSQKVQRADLVQGSGTVPSGMVEVIKKQHEGWAYIKAGF
ncbi:MAG: DsrE family protein [Lewinellaceae bacterium]|nr:DsrE family protein [Lewinellaceae bacterium]